MIKSRMVVQSDRLRDQVYRILREDLQSGAIPSGQRLVEVELASRYGVSRTPIREALFQLAREGLLVQSERGGYSLPTDTQQNFLDRMAVRLTLDPVLAAHAAQRGTAPQKQSLARFYKKMCDANANGQFTEFAEAAHDFRLTLQEMSHNLSLARICRVLEDQFLLMRNERYRNPGNRQIATSYDGRLLKAVEESNSEQAAEIARDYIELLIQLFDGEQQTSRKTPWVPQHPPTPSK